MFYWTLNNKKQQYIYVNNVYSSFFYNIVEHFQKYFLYKINILITPIGIKLFLHIFVDLLILNTFAVARCFLS